MNGQNFFENKKEKDDKPKISVALQYNPDEEAPKIIASGRGIIADKIIDKAKENDVPVYQDSKLANTLSCSSTPVASTVNTRRTPRGSMSSSRRSTTSSIRRDSSGSICWPP